jgi:hypothetical protein
MRIRGPTPATNAEKVTIAKQLGGNIRRRKIVERKSWKFVENK